MMIMTCKLNGTDEKKKKRFKHKHTLRLILDFQLATRMIPGGMKANNNKEKENQLTKTFTIESEQVRDCCDTR